MADQEVNQPKTPATTENVESQLKRLLTSGTSPPAHAKNENRVTVLVAVAKIDSGLNQLLLKRLAPSAEEDEDELLADGRPIGSFMLKAKLARRLGLISGDFYSAMSILSKVRNLCAHREEEFEIFEDTSVKQRVDNIWSRLDPVFQSTPGQKDEKLANTTKDKFIALTSSCEVFLRVTTRQTHPIQSAPKEPIFPDEVQH